MNAIEFNKVSKKFRKGEKFNSLRDSIPNFFRSRLLKNKENGLGKQEFWALRDVSFQIKEGEVVGIIGPNGAGKSTILKLLSGIMNPNKGDVKIRGRLSALIEVAAGFHADLTGRENIYLNGTIMGMTRKEIDSKFDEIVEFSGLAEFIDTPVKRYSSGMFSRLGFSVAAHMDPDVLLVDEVLAVGDIAFQAKCVQKMRELLSSGVTIILVSHNLSLVQALCKRAILLDKGEIQKEGSPAEVIPYYENIVYKQTEEELKKKASHADYRVKIKQESKVRISDVLLYDGNSEQKASFNIQEPISIKIEYEANEKIDAPTFSLEIIRSDGVLCCFSDSRNNGLKINSIEGKGSIKVDLGKISLAPGLYMTRISIWDKDMIHPYEIRNKDVLRIESDTVRHSINPVFISQCIWEEVK